jgi:modulator of FtsH protease HflK
VTTPANTFVEKSLKTVQGYVKWIGLVVILGVLFSGVTFIRPDEVGLILRFGRLNGNNRAQQVLQPGLHFAFPYLIDNVVRVPVKRVQEVVVDDLYSSGSTNSKNSIGYVLTGDENIILVNAVLKYQISDPVKYVLESKDPQESLKRLLSGSLVREIAAAPVDYTLTDGKMELGELVLQNAQRKVDEMDLGVRLISIEFTHLQPPSEVRGAFESVNSAYVEKSTKLQEANRYMEENLPRAMAEKEQLVLEAEAFKANRVAQAREDVAQFYGILEEYKRNPEIVYERLYREKVMEIMESIGTKIYLPDGQSLHNIMLQ